MATKRRAVPGLGLSESGDITIDFGTWKPVKQLVETADRVVGASHPRPLPPRLTLDDMMVYYPVVYRRGFFTAEAKWVAFSMVLAVALGFLTAIAVYHIL